MPGTSTAKTAYTDSGAFAHTHTHTHTQTPAEYVISDKTGILGIQVGGERGTVY